MRSLAEAFAMERDASIPDEELPNDSSRIRRMVFRDRVGFTHSELAERIGKPNPAGRSLASQTLRVLRLLGFRIPIIREPVGKNGEAVFRCENPDHDPSEADYAAMYAGTRPKARDRKPKAKKEIVPTEPKSRSRAVEPEPRGLVLNGHSQGVIDALPRLTEAVFVVGLAIDDDGAISMMLRSQNGAAWTAEVHGATLPG